ncbi:MAG: helix-turn-helix domain-containing protein [Promethearchaeota archaeon]
MNDSPRNYGDIKRQAERLGNSKATLYRWIQSYRESGLEGLIPGYSRSGRKPKSIPPEFEEELQQSITKCVRDGGRISKKSYYRDCEKRLRKCGLHGDFISYSTFCRRIDDIKTKISHHE